MSDEVPSGRRSELSPEAQALDQRARDLVSDLTDLDVAPSSDDAGPPGADQSRVTSNDLGLPPIPGQLIPDVRPGRWRRMTDRAAMMRDLLFGRTSRIGMVAFLLFIVLIVAYLFLSGDGDGDRAAAPPPPADAEAAVVDDPADAPDEAAADPDAATPAAGECLLSGVLEVSSVMTGTEEGEMEPVFGGLAYTAYRGQATITNTSDQAIRVRTLHQSFSDQAGTWSGGHRLEAGGSVVEDINGSVYEDGRSVYDVLASVAAIVDSPDCLQEYGSADYAAFEDVAVAVPNPLPVGP